MLIDSHTHLHDRQFFSEAEAEEMLARAATNDVLQLICIGTDPQDSLAAKDFAEAHEGVFWTYGVHPEESNGSFSSPRSSRPSLRGSAAISRQQPPRCAEKSPFGSNRLVAIGEVGLDYHSEDYDREAQIRLLEEMLQLARDHQLPVSFHVRNAFDDFFAIIKNFPEIKGVVHSFTDSKKTLKKILNETDFYVGVNGLTTYSTLPLPPLERILLETDAPFLTPVPNRGKINESAYIKDIAYWLSNKLEVSSEEIADKTTENARRLFNLSNSVLRKA